MEYAKDRRAFGKPIIEFQNTRFVLAGGQGDHARSAHLRRPHRRSSGSTASSMPSLASMGKFWITERQGEGRSTSACSCFGGYGYMTEYPIARMYCRRARAANLRWQQRDPARVGGPLPVAGSEGRALSSMPARARFRSSI